MKAITWAVNSVRGRGFVETMKVAASVVVDLSFDLRHGTSTMRRVNVQDFGAVGDKLAHSRNYVATKARPLWILLSSLDLPRNSGFVDLGAGKGRVLLIAAQYGFRNVVGVEFSPKLCEYARRNIQIFRERCRSATEIDIVQSDASTYPIQPDQNVFFMFNPFGAVVMTQVLANLCRSVETAPRGIWLIYNTPIHHDLIASTGIFRDQCSRNICGTNFRVYSNK
jgi:predicted RNA methylase